MLTCDSCASAYSPSQESATAHLYVADHRCNHIEARCSHCGATEIIYLGPNRFTQLLEEFSLPVAVYAEADPQLRVRAERAWAAAHEGSRRTIDYGDHPAGRGSRRRSEQGGDTLKQYELTPRHEELLAGFGSALAAIPDELLWDGLQGQHDAQHPARWVD